MVVVWEIVKGIFEGVCILVAVVAAVLSLIWLVSLGVDWYRLRRCKSCEFYDTCLKYCWSTCTRTDPEQKPCNLFKWRKQCQERS